MSYVTQSGEVRTTVCVRLTAEELERLDAQRLELAREQSQRAWRRGMPNTARMIDEDPLGHVSRADAVRWLLLPRWER